MRATPSGGVGSIQDQGVNYIQLNIQPPIPLLNTELRNATLNKDYERSTPLDRAQLTAPSGQPRPRGPGCGGGGDRAKKASLGREPAAGWAPRLARFFPFFHRQLAGLSPPAAAPSPASPQGPGKWRLELRASVSSSAPGMAPHPWPAQRFPGRPAWRRHEGSPLSGPGPAGGGPRLPPPSLAGTDPGRVSLRAEGTGGRGRLRGGAGGALRLSGALRRDLGPGPGLLAQSLPSSGPPFCPGHSPQVVQTELPGAGNRRTGRNRGVSLARRSLGAQGPAPGRLGRRGPSGPSSLLPSSPGRWCRLSQGLPCARCPSPASGCCLLSGPRSPPRLF